jgi:ABC-type uncharacterized transport system substrate-binding protein
VIFDRWAEGEAERLHGLAKELIGSQVDALVAVGTPATLAATSVTSKVPIVFVAVSDRPGSR